MNIDMLFIPLGSITGVFIGFIFRLLYERNINKIIKLDEIILNNEISNLKEKLDKYWSIYFKLLICLSAKLQIKKIKESSDGLINMIQMENDVIIKNLEDIVSIITKNTQILDMDDYLLDLILRFISHVLAYKCLRQSNIKRLPSEYGFPFPDKFTHEITRRTLLIQSKYDEYLGRKYNSEKLKGIKYLNISFDYIEKNNNNESDIYRKNELDIEFQKKLKEIHIKTSTIITKNNNNDEFYNNDDDQDSINIDPDDIDLNEIFICTYQNNNENINENINNNLDMNIFNNL
jgi:hypothetical protein